MEWSAVLFFNEIAIVLYKGCSKSSKFHQERKAIAEYV